MAGGAASVSSNTSYVESASGVGEGARTGVANLVTGGLFLLAMFDPDADAERIAGATRAQLLATRGLGHRAVLKDADVLDRIAGFLGARAA